MKRAPRQYSREKRKQQIIRQFAVWYEKGDEEPKSSYRIAKALGLVPSQHVIDILNEMVMEGKMTAHKRDKSGRWAGNGYLVIKTLITEKYGKRRFVVKHKGLVVDSLTVPDGQARLF